MRPPRIDEYTFKLVMREMSFLIQGMNKNPIPPHDEALKDCTAHLLNFSTAMFRVLSFIRIENPELYESLKTTSAGHIKSDWAKIIHSHAFELEKTK